MEGQFLDKEINFFARVMLFALGSVLLTIAIKYITYFLQGKNPVFIAEKQFESATNINGIPYFILKKFGVKMPLYKNTLRLRIANILLTITLLIIGLYSVVMAIVMN